MKGQHPEVEKLIVIHISDKALILYKDLIQLNNDNDDNNIIINN